MHWLARFVMGGRSQATLVAAASAVLALAAPPLTSPLSYLGGAVIALVTLRLGSRQGMVLLVAASVGTAVLGELALGQGRAVVLATLLLWIPAWFLAMILRNSASLSLTMQGAALLGIAALFGVYLVYGDPAPWWRELLTPVMTPLLRDTGITTPPEQWIERAAGMMTGILAAATVLGLVLTVLLARAWQAMLYNPGGFRTEFHGLRLNAVTGWITLGLVILAQAGSGLPSVLALQTALILFVMYFLAGLAVVHGMLGIFHAHTGWLVAIYALLLIVPPQTLLLLGLIGLTDSWLDFRGRAIRGRDR